MATLLAPRSVCSLLSTQLCKANTDNKMTAKFVLVMLIIFVLCGWLPMFAPITEKMLNSQNVLIIDQLYKYYDEQRVMTINCKWAVDTHLPKTRKI